MNALTFGYNRGLPEGVRAAWGARLIVAQDGHVDFVPGRSSDFGTDEDLGALFRELDARFPIADLRETVREFLLDRTIDTRQEKDVGLYTDEALLVLANTNASAGYLYVCAFLRKHVPAEATA